MTSFSNALEDLKLGCKITREDWNDHIQSLELQRPDEDDETSEPGILLNNAEGEQVSWKPSLEDILAEDWKVL